MPREPLHNPRCFANHLGIYACEPGYLTRALAAIKEGTWPARAPKGDWEDENGEGSSGPPPPLYRVVEGVAIIPVSGPMMKGWSKYASANTLQVRRAIRAAAADTNVRGILLHIDSPGGTSAGTQELADDVFLARKQKPVHAHIDDMGASAAYWVAAQAERLSVNRTGVVGSIGTYLIVADTSKAAELAGVKVHVLSTGSLKGAGADGTPITDEFLREMQRWVDAVNAHFLEGIERGRGAKGLRGEALQKVADGRIWVGEEARVLQLVDAVENMDEAHAAVLAAAERIEAVARADRARARLAQQRS